MTVRSFAASCAAVLTLFAAGCSADEPTGPPPPTPIGDGPLRVSDPCTLLPASAVSAAGLRRATPTTPGPALPSGFRDCRWEHEANGAMDYQVNVTVIASKDFPMIDGNPAFAVDTMSPGGREGDRLRYKDTGGCAYVLDTGPAERVSITVLGKGTVEEACALLDTHATSVVEALPDGV